MSEASGTPLIYQLANRSMATFVYWAETIELPLSLTHSALVVVVGLKGEVPFLVMHKARDEGAVAYGGAGRGEE